MPKDIEISQLKEGFEIGVNHIQKMLDASKILFDAERYTMSISLAILSLEEITKISEISEHIRAKKAISNTKWSKLTQSGSHNTKLTKLFVDSQNKVIEMGEKHHKKVQELSKKLGEIEHFDYQTLSGEKIQMHLLKNLNIIKKECFYLDYKENNWKTFATTFKPKGQAILAEVLYYQNLGILLSIMLQHTTPVASLDEQSPKFKSYRDNPFRKKLEEIREIENTKEFKEKVAVARAILMDYSK